MLERKREIKKPEHILEILDISGKSILALIFAFNGLMDYHKVEASKAFKANYFVLSFLS